MASGWVSKMVFSPMPADWMSWWVQRAAQGSAGIGTHLSTPDYPHRPLLGLAHARRPAMFPGGSFAGGARRREG
jgi:hypothetical protein